MVADYLLAAGERSHSLDALARRHLDRRTTPISDLIGKGKEQKLMFEVEVEEVTELRRRGRRRRLAARRADAGESSKRNTSGTCTKTVERPLIPVLARMEHAGIKVDPEELERAVRGDHRAAGGAGGGDSDLVAGHEFNVRSNKQLQVVLFEKLKPAGRQTHQDRPVDRRGGVGKTRPQTPPARLGAGAPRAEQAAGHLRRRPAEARQPGHRPRSLFLQSGRHRDRPAEFVPTRTSKTSPSAPRRAGGCGRRSSRANRAGSCYRADYSQVELRFLAHYSGDAALVDAFREDRDVHAAVAAEIFGVPLEEVTREQRNIAKTTNFGVIYGPKQLRPVRDAGHPAGRGAGVHRRLSEDLRRRAGPDREDAVERAERRVRLHDPRPPAGGHRHPAAVPGPDEPRGADGVQHGHPGVGPRTSSSWR